MLTGENLTPHLTQSIEELVMPNNKFMVQHCRNLDAYNVWVKKYLHARIILLSNMNDDLLEEYYIYSRTKEL